MINTILLKELNEIAGMHMEGNLCYLHQQVPENNEFFHGFETKRKNLVAIAAKYNNITEIGFNAGHSAAIVLSANLDLHLTSVDIGHHSYTVPCANVIQNYFVSRHQLILKNSKKIEKNEIENSNVVIIDGGHHFEDCLFDIATCIAYCKPGTLIVIDDYDYTPVNAATKRFSSSLKICNEFISDAAQGIFYLI